MFAGIFSCTPSFSPEINKVYLILSYLIIITGNDSDLGRFRLWSRNERTILTLTPVRVGIGIV